MRTKPASTGASRHTSYRTWQRNGRPIGEPEARYGPGPSASVLMRHDPGEEALV